MKQTVAPAKVWIECRSCLRSFLVQIGFSLQFVCPACGELGTLRQLEPLELVPRRELYQNSIRVDASSNPAVSTPEKKEETPPVVRTVNKDSPDSQKH